MIASKKKKTELENFDFETFKELELDYLSFIRNFESRKIYPLLKEILEEK